MIPKYDYGQALRVIRSIRDDGSYPGASRGELLVQRGELGHVVDVGTFLQDQLIYTMHFIERDIKVGCREQELIPAEAPWVESRFEFLEWVQTGCQLAVQGRVLVEHGARGQVLKVLRPECGDVSYQVRFAGRTLQVPERVLEVAP